MGFMLVPHTGLDILQFTADLLSRLVRCCRFMCMVSCADQRSIDPSGTLSLACYFRGTLNHTRFGVQ